MKKVLLTMALVAALPAVNASAANVDLNIGVNIGTRAPAPVAVPVPVPVPAPAPAPVYDEPEVDFDEPPLFIEPPELGFHVAVGIPYDVFFIGTNYYLCRGNVWYSAPSYRGPWIVTRYNAVPWKIRRYPFERIRHYRDAGYRHYREGRNAYWRGHYFRPTRVARAARRVQEERVRHDRNYGGGFEREKGNRDRGDSRGGRGDWEGRGHGRH